MIKEVEKLKNKVSDRINQLNKIKVIYDEREMHKESNQCWNRSMELTTVLIDLKKILSKY